MSGYDEFELTIADRMATIAGSADGSGVDRAMVERRAAARARTGRRRRLAAGLAVTLTGIGLAAAILSREPDRSVVTDDPPVTEPAPSTTDGPTTTPTEPTGTTEVPATSSTDTTVAEDHQTTLPPELVHPTETRELSAVYLATIRDGGDHDVLDQARAAAGDLGYETTFLVYADCVLGAEEQFGLPPEGNPSVAVLFDTPAHAQQFVDAYEPDIVGIVRGEYWCSGVGM